MSEYKDIIYAVDDNVGIITLNRPQARNALTWNAYDEVRDAVLNAKVNCLVITGADPGFCAGDDVKEIMAGPSGPPADELENNPHLTPLAEAILYTDIPVIAAVNGIAVGWGMELSIMADIRVASEKARFGELFVLRGLCCEVAGLARLSTLVGREKAAELVFTGDIISAVEAHRIGLVSRLVPHSELMDTTLELAHRIAANPPLAVQSIKAGLRKALDPDFRELGVWASLQWATLFKTEDHKEGVQAFLEKRKPVYKGQ